MLKLYMSPENNKNRCPSIDNLGMRPKGVFLRQNEELDVIKELQGLQLEYDDAKKKINGATDLTYTNSKLASDLDTSLNNILSGIIHDDTLMDDDEEEIQESARSIKERAMKNKVNPIKHLIGVEDRSPTKKTPSTPDLKSPAGKVKITSPIKRITSKRNLRPPPKSYKRKRKSSESSDTSDTSPEKSKHNSVDILANFDQATSNTDTVEAETTELQIDNPNIHFNSLPCVITSESNGQVVEIEIIDKLKESTNMLNSTAGRKQLAIEAENAVNNKTRKEKRDLKKTILKSRFKRMGLDPVANFKTT